MAGKLGLGRKSGLEAKLSVPAVPAGPQERPLKEGVLRGALQLLRKAKLLLQLRVLGLGGNKERINTTLYGNQPQRDEVSNWKGLLTMEKILSSVADLWMCPQAI